MGGAGGDAERRRQWGALFDQLDANKDGRVDVEELRQGLARLGMSAGARAEEVLGRLGLGIGTGRVPYRGGGFGETEAGDGTQASGPPASASPQPLDPHRSPTAGQGTQAYGRASAPAQTR